MPFSVPIFGGFFSLGSCSTAADSFQVYCAIILLGVGAGKVRRHCTDDLAFSG